MEEVSKNKKTPLEGLKAYHFLDSGRSKFIKAIVVDICLSHGSSHPTGNKKTWSKRDRCLKGNTENPATHGLHRLKIQTIACMALAVGLVLLIELWLVFAKRYGLLLQYTVDMKDTRYYQYDILSSSSL